MGVNTAASTSTHSARAPAARADNNNSSSTSSTNGETPSEEEFNRLFEEAMKRSNAAVNATANTSSKASGNSDKSATRTPQLDMSQDEQKKFLSAMQNPEFRSLLNEYMTEISDPENRAETEQYLAQLENEQKVPEDKVLVRPVPGFVVKVKWQEEEKASAESLTQKMFVNVCSSDKMQPPSSTPVADATGKKGTSWNLPYSVGPERLEKDKGGAMVLTFDVCFHPTTLGFAKAQRTYRDMVVKICLDAIEGLVRESRRKPKAVVSRDYHVLKGVFYKSGDPVTMCLRKPAAEKKPETAVKSNIKTSDKKKTASPSAAKINRKSTKEKPIDVVARKKSEVSNDLKLDFETEEKSDNQKPELLKEVSSTKKAVSIESVEVKKRLVAPATPSLKKIAFKLVYRGKFELLNHMQAEHENVVPVERNRPKEFVVEMEFPTLASAAGIDLDVSENSLKLMAKGYEPLDIKLPFPVFEAKGSAKFDKKARKLVVTLPVQPPSEPKPKSVTLIVEEEDDNEADTTDLENQDEPEEIRHNQQVQPKKTVPSPSVAPQDKPRGDDKFAMLRETAIMVQHDPHFLPRASSSKPEVTKVPPSAEIIETYDDLPPLESCSEDEDGEEGDDDLVFVDAPASPQEKVAPHVAATSAGPLKPVPFTTKETATCLSFIIAVPGIDATSVLLDFPSSTSFILRFNALVKSDSRGNSKLVECFELKIDSLKHEVDASQAEYDVASENMVVILRKKGPTTAPTPSGGATSTKDGFLSSTSAPLPTASIAPVVRFQNQLLYELD